MQPELWEAGAERPCLPAALCGGGQAVKRSVAAPFMQRIEARGRVPVCAHSQPEELNVLLLWPVKRPARKASVASRHDPPEIVTLEA